jgi:hypothetical protein
MRAAEPDRYDKWANVPSSSKRWRPLVSYMVADISGAAANDLP